ncbi:MAG: hypothetical protein GY757_20955 [bacterium]|nr:hypothetical protein [bacterium]
MSKIIFKKLTVQEKKEIQAGKFRLKAPFIVGDKSLHPRPFEIGPCGKEDTIV